MSKSLEMVYAGSFKTVMGTYEVVEDKTIGIVNLFYRNTKYNEVECFSVASDLIYSVGGLKIIDKAKNYWLGLNKLNQKQLNIELENVHVQTFPMGFWEDVVMEIKNGDLKDKEIRMLTPSEGDLN